MKRWIASIFEDSDKTPSSARVMSFMAACCGFYLAIAGGGMDMVIVLLAYSVSAKTFGKIIEGKHGKSKQLV